MLLVLFSCIFKLSPTCLSPVICSLAVFSVERLGQDPLKSMTTPWGRAPLRQGLALISHWVLAPDFQEVSYQGELDDSLRAVFAWTRGENRLFGGRPQTPQSLQLFLQVWESLGQELRCFLLGSFCFLGEQFQEGGTVPKAERRRVFQEKKKKKELSTSLESSPQSSILQHGVQSCPCF